MLSTMKNRNRTWVVIIPLLLVILAVVAVLLWRPGGILNSSASSSIPVTGISLASNSAVTQMGMSQRSIEAYSGRMTGLAKQQVTGMSQRSIDAYSARLSRAAGVPAIMSRRARDAYSARLEGLAQKYQGMTGK